MARKKGFDYFAAMEQLATNGHLAAKRFSLLINDYSETALSEAAAEIHGLEKEGDQPTDLMIFIPPTEVPIPMVKEQRTITQSGIEKPLPVFSARLL